MVGPRITYMRIIILHVHAVLSARRHQMPVRSPDRTAFKVRCRTVSGLKKRINSISSEQVSSTVLCPQRNVVAENGRCLSYCVLSGFLTVPISVWGEISQPKCGARLDGFYDGNGGSRNNIWKNVTEPATSLLDSVLQYDGPCKLRIERFVPKGRSSDL
jgi:hypothetical protein